MIGGTILNLLTPNTGIGVLNERATIAYKSVLTTGMITLSNNQSQAGYLIDGMTTTAWETVTGTNTIDLTLSGIDIDCIAFGPSNWGESTAVIQIDVTDASGTETVFNKSGFADNDPILATFDSKLAISIEITITTTDVLYLSQMLAGECMKFPCGVSVGYQPARWTSDNQVNTFKTESNTFGQATVFNRGTTESFSVENIDQDFMDSQWVDFISNAIGYNIWFGWNTIDYPEQVTYGSWSMPRPTFTSSTLSSVNLTIQGVSS